MAFGFEPVTRLSTAVQAPEPFRNDPFGADFPDTFKQLRTATDDVVAIDDPIAAGFP